MDMQIDRRTSQRLLVRIVRVEGGAADIRAFAEIVVIPANPRSGISSISASWSRSRVRATRRSITGCEVFMDKAVLPIPLRTKCAYPSRNRVSGHSVQYGTKRPVFQRDRGSDMHITGHKHGHGFSVRGRHAGAIIGFKLLAVVATIILVPYWSGWITWFVAAHAALALFLLFVVGLALFRHAIALRGSSHDSASHGVTIHGAAFYDLLASVMTMGRERRLRRAMLGVAKLRPGESVLDVACGTGTLAIAAAAEVGTAGEVVGVDASTQMLTRATQKAAQVGAKVHFVESKAQSLPFPPARFDVMTGTLMLHHISGEARIAFAMEAKRVLKPGGRLVLVDFGSAATGSKLFGLHAHGGTDPHNVADRLRDAGYRDIRVGQLGMMNLYSIEATA